VYHRTDGGLILMVDADGSLTRDRHSMPWTGRHDHLPVGPPGATTVTTPPIRATSYPEFVERGVVKAARQSADSTLTSYFRSGVADFEANRELGPAGGSGLAWESLVRVTDSSHTVLRGYPVSAKESGGGDGRSRSSNR
jgi:hypothetical protein